VAHVEDAALRQHGLPMRDQLLIAARARRASSLSASPMLL
jgi:hypothetical protein